MDDTSKIIEVAKEGIKKIISAKTQLIIILFLVILSIYKKFYPSDFQILISTLNNIIPQSFISTLDTLAYPVLNLSSLISNIGLILFILLGIIFELNYTKGIFNAITYNYRYYFVRKGTNLFDSLFEKLVCIPVNIIFIIIGIYDILDINQDLVKSFFEQIWLRFPLLFVASIYFYSCVSLLYRKIDD